MRVETEKMDSKERYRLLKIKKTASQEDIKKAYRKLAMEFHPDVNRGNRASDPYAPGFWRGMSCMGKCSGHDPLFRQRHNPQKNITAGQ